MIVKLERSRIDTALWDKLVEGSYKYNPNAYSWYLDEVSLGWSAWILLDAMTGAYQAALPVPYVRKWGIRYVRQSPFCFQLGILSVKPFDKYSLLYHFLSSERFISEYYFNEPLDPDHFPAQTLVANRTNYVLSLGSAAENCYNQNRRRELKRFEASGARVVCDAPHEVLPDLFYQHTSKKIYGIRSDQYQQMLRIATLYQQKLSFYSLAIIQHEQPIGAAWFLGAGRKAYYLMASYAPKAYELGGATGLVHTFIKQRGHRYESLSFNGSDETGVASFYKSFGAKKESFTSIRHVALPAGLKSLMKARTRIIQTLNR